MSRYTFIFFFIIFEHTSIFGQKPPVDTVALANWPQIEYPQISNDGSFAVYNVSSNLKGTSLIAVETSSGGKTDIDNINKPWTVRFTEDSRNILYINQGDTLVVRELKTNKIRYIAGVVDYKTPSDGDGRWLACLLSTNELCLCDLSSGLKRRYSNVIDFDFDSSGSNLFYQSCANHDTCCQYVFHWLDLVADSNHLVWTGPKVTKSIFQKKSNKVIFITDSAKSLHVGKEIWYFKPNMEHAKLWVSKETTGFPVSYEISDDLLSTNGEGNKLFFNIRKAAQLSEPNSRLAQVDVWNYRDEYSQSEQLSWPKWALNPRLDAVAFEERASMLILENENEGLAGDAEINSAGNSNFILVRTRVNYSQGYHNEAERPDIYLVSTDNGNRVCISKRLLNGEAHFSPFGKYVIWYDWLNKAFFTFNINTGITQNITKTISYPVSTEGWDGANDPPPYAGVYDPPVWLENDTAVLIYDRYDIWQVDPSGRRPPISISNGFGRKNKTVLRFVYFDQSAIRNGAVSTLEKSLTLCGFNEVTKANGFFRTRIFAVGEPEKLIMSNSVFYFPGEIDGLAGVNFIAKAKNAESYILNRMTATEYPNVYFTKTFKSFNPLSKLDPQAEYNWLTSELYHWKTFEGLDGQGVLYKPENFDSTKRYPVIVYFYDRLAGQKNVYIEPSLSAGPMNIPWFVSRGYLVFCPDIYYVIGDPGRSIYDFVVSAATNLARKPWVDRNSLAIQGHSWGGFEVNYLVTRTNLFAAAVSAAGASDLISHYGEPTLSALSSPSFTERGSYRMKKTIWENPYAYIRNSPIFGVDKVTTPILMMHNKDDGNVPWIQAIEFYTDLCRLNKRCWLLQYDNDGHIVTGINSLDYTIRLEQFFNHYLKGEPEPKWMSTGVPASKKGIESGLDMPDVKR